MRIVNEIMKEADHDRDGEISFEEFIKAIGNTP
jgi:Ca2+-binding EF-hand superfamily protein